jgi:DeoR/GlpR family transcriptional regulator of sugar metabolism
MNPFKRRSLIQDLLSSETMMEVRALAEALGVSEASIRRDLAFLEKQGLLQRVRGGAVLALEAEGGRPFAMKVKLHAEEKRRIGQKVAEMIRPGEYVVLDSGSTVVEVARYLQADPRKGEGKITVITGSLPVIQLLAHRPDVEVVIIGGLFYPQYETVVGPQATAFLQDLNADKFIMATDGITFERGYTTNHPLEAELMRAMDRISSETIVVADSSKVGRSGFVSVLPVDGVDALVTDSGVPADFVREMEELGVRVTVV